MNNVKIEYVMEIYERITIFIEKMVKESFGEKASLEIFFGKKYEKFKKILIQNIILLCNSNCEFLINEGYFRYIYCRRFRLSKQHYRGITLLNETDYLKYFSDDNNWPFIVDRYTDYIEFIISFKKNSTIYQHEGNFSLFLEKEIDEDLMKNFDNLNFLLEKTLFRFQSGYIDAYMLRKIIVFIYVYLYINKIDFDLENLYSSIDINLIDEYLLLNNVYTKKGNFCYKNSMLSYRQIEKIIYQYIIDAILNKEIEHTERINKK